LHGVEGSRGICVGQMDGAGVVCHFDVKD
jgi:hypothetical protein